MIILIILLAVINGIIFVYVSRFQDPQLADLLTKWSDLRRKAAAASRADAATLYRQAELDLTAIRTHIPQKREFPRVLGDIIEAATTSGVVTSGMNYKPIVLKDEKLLQYQLNMNVSGSYAAIKSFLADLQRTRELLVVDGISIANSDPYEENASLDLHLSLYLQEAP